MTVDDETFLLLSAYRDGELSPGEVLAMERRLAAEPALRTLAEEMESLSGEVRAALQTPPASDTLRASVIRQIGFSGTSPRPRWQQSWLSAAAMLVIGFLGGGLVASSVYVRLDRPGMQSIEDAVVAGHLRGLIASQPFDVASSDRHVVKPWFNGRTTVAPQAIDLADKGFPLVGGRIDVVEGRAVPTLVYRHDRHLISVTVVPSTAGILGGTDERNGYTVRYWSAEGLTYWLVSDLDTSGIDTFERLFRS